MISIEISTVDAELKTCAANVAELLAQLITQSRAMVRRKAVSGVTP
jgi:hypothetical protein